MNKEKQYVCCFGEILWDVLPTGKMPGGAPMNVGLNLKNLGVDVALISKVGVDDLGEEIKSFVIEKNCSTQWIQSEATHPTGSVLVNLTNRNEVQYEIVHPVAWDFIEATPQAIDVAKDAFAFVFGSLACRSAHTKKALLTLLSQTKAIKIFDVNLRAPHFSRDLIQEFLPKADIVKMNKEELEMISSWLGSGDSIEQKVTHLKKKFGAQMVIVTMGGDGALLLNDEGTYTSKVFKVEVKDTIGSGDAFLAGIIKNLLLKTPPDQMLTYACALGSLVAQHHGANPPIKESEIFEIMQK